MSWEIFNDDCPGCRPAMLDMKTKQRLPDDSPLMKEVNRIYDALPRPVKEAFHRVTCLNSRDSMDLLLVEGMIRRMRQVKLSED